MVIGEDLGTVPVEIVGKLRSSGVYSYKVLYFENDHEKTFRSPKAYPEQSMAVAATHDLPSATRLLGERGSNAGQNAGVVSG